MILNNISPIVKYVFITPWCNANRLKWYKVIMLLAHVSGIANNAVSLLGMVTILNNKECNKIYFSDNISTFCIADLVFGNLFCSKYKYMSSKYGLIKYPACISFTVTGKCIPFRTFLCIIFNFLSKQHVSVKTFALIFLYSLDFAILVVLGNVTCLAFGIFLKIHLDVGNFFKVHVNALFQWVNVWIQYFPWNYLCRYFSWFRWGGL